MKIIVSQYGARHRYAVPQIFEKAGILKALYTDASCYSFLGRLSKRSKFLTKEISRLSARNPLLPINKIFTSDTLIYQNFINRWVKSDKTLKTNIERIFQGMSKKMIGWGIDSTDVLYTMFIENIEFVKFAKRKGAKIVVDIYEDPISYEFFYWELLNNSEKVIDKNDIEKYKIYSEYRKPLVNEILEFANLVLVPSQWVFECLSHYKSFNAEKVRIVPYGSSISYNQTNRPINGKLFFAGEDAYRKGLLNLAEAAEILLDKYPELDFRVAGIIDTDIITSKKFKKINFLGKLNKEEMKQEFLSADMFVFPTLSEGFAGVIIEAASAGCPIITTKCSGVDPNNFPGIIVKDRNSIELADAIENLYLNRDKRELISKEILEYSKYFTIEKWEERLLEAAKTLK